MIRRTPWWLATGLAWAVFAAPTPVVAAGNSLTDFIDCLEAWDIAGAQAIIDSLPAGSERDAQAGILAIYRAEYRQAEALLSAALASQQLPRDSRLAREANNYLLLARGEQRALGPALVQRDADNHFEAVFADARDQLLAPYLFTAMAAARRELGNELGILPDHTVRFEFVDDPAKLADVSPLTLDNVYTTGTIGITKYRRIIMLSPRVMFHGYPWLDTAVHEYVHYLVILHTGVKAPVWLHEGLAKLLESRWRSDKPLPLDPASRVLLGRALTTGNLVTFAEMHPSLAMLPSQERAALAYAQVETMLSILREDKGPAGIRHLLAQVANGVAAEDAFASAWGDSFAAFAAHWQATMRRRTATTSDGPKLRKPEFRNQAEPTPDLVNNPAADPSLIGDVFSHLGGGKARQHARLGVLLLLRGHLAAAARQYEKARKAEPARANDPQLARRLGELYLQLDRPADAAGLLRLAAAHDPENANLAAAEGRALRLQQDFVGARAALFRAVQHNPFIPSIHCDLAVVAETQAEREREQTHCNE